MPIASTAARIYSGVTTGWDALVNSTEGLTAQQGAEILSNMLGNRPIAGLIETFGAGGYDTDKSGQVGSKNVIEENRKSVGEGKSASEREDPEGRRTIKK